MKRGACFLALLMLVALPTLGFPASFKVYPGARVEDVYDPKKLEAGTKMSEAHKVIIFTTNDFFENVVAFYRGIAREYRMPGTGGKPMKLSSGQEFKEVYFIFDNATDLSTSKHWIRVQRPYLDKGRRGDPFYGKYEKVREVTAIIEEDKRGYP